MIDFIVRICLHSWDFCLDRQEQRVDKFRDAWESDHRYVHSLAANLWIDSSWSVTNDLKWNTHNTNTCKSAKQKLALVFSIVTSSRLTR